MSFKKNKNEFFNRGKKRSKNIQKFQRIRINFRNPSLLK